MSTLHDQFKNEHLSRILQEISLEEKISLHKLPTKNIYCFQRQNAVCFTHGFYLDANPHAIAETFKDKEATYLLLKHLGFLSIPHFSLDRTILENPDALKNRLSLFPVQDQIVCKPNFLAGGEGCVRVSSFSQLLEELKELFATYHAVCLSPFIESKEEYRVVMANFSTQIIYRKERPFVVGNGKSSLEQLIMDKFQQILPHKTLQRIMKWNLKQKDQIINQHEKVVVYWQHNLTYGATAHLDVPHDIYLSLADVAENMARKVGMKFVTIDFLKKDEQFFVLEINSGLVMELFIDQMGPGAYPIVKEIYREAILEALDSCAKDHSYSLQDVK